MNKFKLKKIFLISLVLTSSLLSLTLISYQNQKQKDNTKFNASGNTYSSNANGRIVYDNIIKKINSDLGLNFDKKLFDVNSPDYGIYVKKYSQWVEKNFEYLTNITNANALKTKTNNNLQYAYNGGFQLRNTFWNYYWYIPSWHRKDLWEKSTGDQEVWEDICSVVNYGKWKIVQIFLTKILPKFAIKFAKLAVKLSIPGAGIACLTQCVTVWMAASIARRAGVVCRIFSPAISPPVFTGSWPFEEDDWD